MNRENTNQDTTANDTYMKPMKKSVSITLDEDIIPVVKRMAEKDDRSFSQYINMIVRKFVNEGWKL